jgi:hypothetical protein
MSSGDESDDMDLTEGSSCGSDISQWNEGTRSRVLYHWQTYLVYSKMTPRQRNMFSHFVTPRCLGTTVFQRANLPLGLIAPSSPFGYGTTSLTPGIIVDAAFLRIAVPTLILLFALRLR